MKALGTLVALLYCGLAFANSPVGTFMVVKGDVKVQRANGKLENARIGLKVFPKDLIQTFKDARGKIVMVDKNVINLSPDTKMEIQDYTYKPEDNKKSVLLNLMYGKVRPQVNQKYDEKNNTFRVKTAAAVAGVRGTDFIVSFQNNRSQITTFHGMVSVGSSLNSSGQIANAVHVAAGQATIVSMNASPRPPVSVPPSQLTTLEKESNPETVPETDNRQPATQEPVQDATTDEAVTTEPTSESENAPGPSRETQSVSVGLPPPPPPPVNEQPVLDFGPGAVAGNLPPAPPPDIPSVPINPVIGDIIQQTSTSINVIIVAPD